uniref:Testis expressed 101 n=1 Tax=Rousettus aegyptiacus TaxID=9407 RepID=A0A7J8CMJ9_ROUAE|nr:testis expressed 101 [Rousettus aegyptiacus]
MGFRFDLSFQSINNPPLPNLCGFGELFECAFSSLSQWYNSMLSRKTSDHWRRLRLNFGSQRLYICNWLQADVWDLNSRTHVGEGNVSIPVSHSTPKD